MTTGAQSPRPKVLRKARIELFALELEGRLLDLRAHDSDYGAALASGRGPWIDEARYQLLASARMVCVAHAALVKARGK
jgi:hypothetical protein